MLCSLEAPSTICATSRIAHVNVLAISFTSSVGDAVYVLHCLEKKTQRTAKADIELGKKRYRQMKTLIDVKEIP